MELFGFVVIDVDLQNDSDTENFKKILTAIKSSKSVSIVVCAYAHMFVSKYVMYSTCVLVWYCYCY